MDKRMRHYSMNQDNPLTKYKLDKDGISWEKISEEIGLFRVTLSNIAKKDKEQIMLIPIGTYLKIKEGLGVDLIEDWSEDK